MHLRLLASFCVRLREFVPKNVPTLPAIVRPDGVAQGPKLAGMSSAPTAGESKCLLTPRIYSTGASARASQE
jgi:hypothetical protein